MQNLNTNQVLPYGDEEFDLCTIAVSVQYLTSPVRVFEEIARVLKPNGKCCVSFSNRMFPTKAILAWRLSSNEDHCDLVTQYFKKTEMFDEVIIRQDRNLRGKDEETLIKEIHDGILDVDPKKPVKIITLESEAIKYAVEHAKEGSLIVVSSDVVPDALNIVMKLKEKETKELYPHSKKEIPNLKA